jgi:uncharacterized OB-fold protein
VTGIVYAVTTLHAAAERFESDTPFQIAIVDIEDVGRTTVRIVGPSVRIGDTVVALGEKDGVWLFRLSDDSSQA